MVVQTKPKKNMKKRIELITVALLTGTLVLMVTPSYAQKSGAMSKAEAIAQQLNLTPQQKVQVLPILREEVPKVQALKADNSLSRVQKIQQIRTIHKQTDPQMKAILSPAQYQKLQTLRQQAINDATQTYR